MRRPFGQSLTRMIAVAGLLVAAFEVAGCNSKEQRAHDYYTQGMKYIAEHSDVKARLELNNAIQLQDNMLPAWRALSQIDQRAKDWRAVFVDSRRIAELDPKDIEARLQIANFFLLSGHVDKALDWENQASAIDPKNVHTLVLKAAILLKLDDHKGAIQAAQKALAIEPGNLQAEVVLASEKYLSDDPQGAMGILDALSASAENDLGVVLLKTKISEKMGNSTQLELQLKKLIELRPNEIQFRDALVKFYIMHNELDDAEKLLRSTAAAYPKNVQAALNVVRFLDATKGPVSARQELESHIKAGGDVFPFQMAMADIDVSTGKFDDGAQLLNKLINSPISLTNQNAARAKLAALQISRKNIPAAQTLIAKILSTDSSNVDALRLRASIRIDQGQLNDAIADLRQALSYQPRSPALLTLLAMAYERQGSSDLAQKQLANATKESGFAPNIGLNYAAFLIRRGNPSAAEDLLVQLATRNPGNIPILNLLARVRLSRQNWIGAEEVSKAIRRLKAEGVADQIKAAALEGEKKYSQSLKLPENAYADNKGAVEPMYALVRAYIQNQQIDEAEVFLQNVLKTSPDNAEALILLGSVQAAKNQPQQAMASFKTAIARDPKQPGAYIALATLYLHQNKIDEASKTIAAGLREEPDNFALNLTRGGILELRKDFEGAISEYETMLKYNPGSLVVANNLAYLLATHRSDKASLEKAYALAVPLAQSPVPQFKGTLGWIDYRRGDYRSAVSLLEDVVKALPNVAVDHYHLGVSYIAVGDTEKGLQQLKKASEIDPKDADLNAKVQAAINSAASPKKQIN
jgi:tetratricopeptide (TPR) repeat protein